MDCMLNSESRRLYSWWWDSHISPKNSKWLQENLTDMDAKVKSMIKLIEEDADSFARRAEMYYKKRPELMKLVEEFYRAYRALAERYDYATSELRHAQKTLQAAFPNQTHLTLPEDSSSSSIDPDDQKTKSFNFLEEQLENTDEKDELHDEVIKAKCEIVNLKKAIDGLLAEKESILIKYQESLEKFSNADGELNHALEKSRFLDEKATEAEKEVRMLKETLCLLKAEKDSGLAKQMEYLETISDLEEKLKGMDKRAVDTEIEARNLKNKLSRLESENDSGLLQYGKCLDKISVLEKKIMETEEEARRFSEQALMAEMEVQKLENNLLEVTEEKEALRVLYAECLEKSYKLQLDLSSAQAEIVNSTKKLQISQEICVRLEASNQSLKMEASDLAKKIMLKDRELVNKHEELEKLQRCVKDEHTHYVQVEAALQTLQMLYTKSQEELKNDLQMLKDLEDEMQKVKDENNNLKNTEVEIMELKKMKEKLEEEVALQLGQSTAMQQEIVNLKEEINGLNSSYESLMNQIESVGLNPESFGSSIKLLQDENSRLNEKNGDQEEMIRNVAEKNTDLENSCESLHKEKSALVLEKTVLLSQLHIITVNMQKLIDQNTVLENSLSTAYIELENLREKSKNLEVLCESLNNEKSNLINERSNLASQLESVQRRLETLENRFSQFEERKETENSEILKLMSSLSAEKQEREKRVTDLENQVHQWRKEEFQEELDKAVIAQFENFILHKFVQEVEEKNYSLMADREKHIEASKLADKLISELETEILEQQVEEELLLVEVENLRLGIYQVCLSLEIGSKSNGGFKDGGKISVDEIIGNIKDLKRCLLKEQDDKQRLLFENNVMLTLLRESESKFKESESYLKKEMECLREVNGNLEMELDMLNEERGNEFELWEAEATSFVFDLQISNTRDILFENKVYELSGVCENLEGESASKDVEIEEMKEKASVMEKEIEGLKAQLGAYNPIICSLKENILSLEHNVFTIANIIASENRKSEDIEVKVHPEVNGSPKSLEPNGISDLIHLQTRLSALEKVIMEDINAVVTRRETSETDIKLKSTKPETGDQKRNKTEKLRTKRYLTLDNLNITKPKPEISEVRIGVPIRDIPLDQASDGSSSRRGYSRTDDMMIEQLQKAHEVHKIYKTEKKSKKLPYEPQIEDFGVDKLELVPNQDSKKGKLLQRLASDAQKLSSLESTVKDLTKRLETGKKSKKVDFETVKEQLEEAEETILQLVNVNIESKATIEKNPSLLAWVEQDDSWKSSERIKRVQLEIQKIQYVLLKLDDEKKVKGKSRFSRTKSRTSVILRDFIHHGRSNSGRSSTGRRRQLCGCFTPSATKGDRIKM